MSDDKLPAADGVRPILFVERDGLRLPELDDLRPLWVAAFATAYVTQGSTPNELAIRLKARYAALVANNTVEAYRMLMTVE